MINKIKKVKIFLNFLFIIQYSKKNVCYINFFNGLKLAACRVGIFISEKKINGVT
jgi:hypothetical protein